MNMFTSEKKEEKKKQIPTRSQTHINKRNASDENLWNGDAFVMPTLSYSDKFNGKITSDCCHHFGGTEENKRLKCWKNREKDQRN